MARPSTSPHRIRPRAVGVVVDTFHVWWDPALAEQIARAGRENRLAAYQVCDWNLPIAADALLSRGMMGDGYIDFDTIGGWVRDTGYTGDIEVEIFNADIWAADGDQVLATMARRFVDLVLPAAGTRSPRTLTEPAVLGGNAKST